MGSETQFFATDQAGAPVWFQHVLWLLGHWEIYLPLIGAAMIFAIITVLRIRLDIVSRLYAVGGLVFLIGLIASAIMMQNASSQSSFHDTYYVMAHFQYGFGLLFICLVFAVGYWFMRRRYARPLAVIQFACTFLGTALLFFAQFFMSTQSMPRRYVDYDENKFEIWSLLAQAGYLMLFAGIALFIIVIGHASWKKLRA